MIITHHREKLINAIVYFATHTRYCGKTKLLKLLYFLDFKHFKQTGKSVTGLEYFAWEMGPVPRELFEELSGVFKDAKADDMVESTHLRNEPWDITLKQKGEFKPIDYMLAIDSDVVSLPYEEGKERMQERSEMVAVFGAR